MNKCAEYHRQYYQNNRDRIKLRIKNYSKLNKDKIKIYKQSLKHKESKYKSDKKYYEKNKENIQDYHKDYYLKHQEFIKNKAHIWFKNNPEIAKNTKKIYSLKNREKILNHKILYSKKYKDKFREYKRIYMNNRRRNDDDFCIRCRLRRRLLTALEKYGNGKTYTSKKYGVDFTSIIEHLKPFPEDISKYQIDHIAPLSLFDLTDFEQIKKAFAPENHQWLSIKDNKLKGNKIWL